MKKLIYGILIVFSLLLYLKGLSPSIYMQPVIYTTTLLSFMAFIILLKNSMINRRVLFLINMILIMFYSLILQFIFITHINGILNEFGRIVFPYISTSIVVFLIYKIKSNDIWKIIINTIVFLLAMETIYRILLTGVYFPSFENRYLIKGGGIMFIDSNFTGYIAGVLYLLLNKFKSILSNLIRYKIILLLIIFYSMSYSVFAGLLIVLVVHIIQRYYFLKYISIFLLITALYYLYELVGNDGSFLTKIEIIELSYHYVLTHNIFDLIIGVGYGNFATYFSDTDHGAHNFIGMSIEGGLIFVLANIYLYYTFYKNKDNRYALIFIISGGLVSMYPLAYMSTVYLLLFFDQNKDLYKESNPIKNNLNGAKK